MHCNVIQSSVWVADLCIKMILDTQWKQFNRLVATQITCIVSVLAFHLWCAFFASFCGSWCPISRFWGSDRRIALHLTPKAMLSDDHYKLTILSNDNYTNEMLVIYIKMMTNGPDCTIPKLQIHCLISWHNVFHLLYTNLLQIMCTDI